MGLSSPIGARQGLIWVRMSPYMSRTPVRISRVICQGLSGHIGFRRVSVGTLIWHDRTRRGLTDRSTVAYPCTIDVGTPWAHHVIPTGPPGPCRDPTDPWRTAGGTVGPCLIGACPVWAARHSYWRSQCYCILLFLDHRSEHKSKWAESDAVLGGGGNCSVVLRDRGGAY